MFKPKAIYFEKEIEDYPLGIELMEKYKDIPKIEIEKVFLMFIITEGLHKLIMKKMYLVNIRLKDIIELVRR